MFTSSIFQLFPVSAFLKQKSRRLPAPNLFLLAVSLFYQTKHPVLKKSIAKDETITPEDIKWVTMPQTHHSFHIPTSLPSRAKANYHLAAGHVLKK